MVFVNTVLDLIVFVNRRETFVLNIHKNNFSRTPGKFAMMQVISKLTALMHVIDSDEGVLDVSKKLPM